MAQRLIDKQGATPLLIAGIARSPLLIHYGSDRFVPEKVLPVKNDNGVKPKKEGGLWTSPVDSKYGWKQWNDIERFRACHESNSFTVCLKPNSRIFVIDSFLDLKSAPLIDGDHGVRVLDFECIAKNYDAIWLTKKGYDEAEFTYPINLYAWSCETVLLLNPNCCTAVY